MFIVLGYIIVSVFIAFSFTDACTIPNASQKFTTCYSESTVRISRANSSPVTGFASSSKRTRRCSTFQFLTKRKTTHHYVLYHQIIIADTKVSSSSPRSFSFSCFSRGGIQSERWAPFSSNNPLKESKVFWYRNSSTQKAFYHSNSIYMCSSIDTDAPAGHSSLLNRWQYHAPWHLF